jgi:hypothetical protein
VLQVENVWKWEYGGAKRCKKECRIPISFKISYMQRQLFGLKSFCGDICFMFYRIADVGRGTALDSTWIVLVSHYTLLQYSRS